MTWFLRCASFALTAALFTTPLARGYMTCADCRHFRETHAKPVAASLGACVRYPKILQPIARTYGCGEWRSIPIGKIR